MKVSKKTKQKVKQAVKKLKKHEPNQRRRNTPPPRI